MPPLSTGARCASPDAKLPWSKARVCAGCVPNQGDRRSRGGPSSKAIPPRLGRSRLANGAHRSHASLDPRCTRPAGAPATAAAPATASTPRRRAARAGRARAAAPLTAVPTSARAARHHQCNAGVVADEQEGVARRAGYTTKSPTSLRGAGLSRRRTAWQRRRARAPARRPADDDSAPRAAPPRCEVPSPSRHRDPANTAAPRRARTASWQRRPAAATGPLPQPRAAPIDRTPRATSPPRRGVVARAASRRGRATWRRSAAG
jgi:hypothetical protein